MAEPRSRAERLAANQAEKREANEHLGAGTSNLLLFFCECSETLCAGFVHLTQAEYDRIHANPMQFVLVAGHEDETVEAIVDHGKDYVVAHKFEGARDIVKR
jgi:hypothetical protein